MGIEIERKFLVFNDSWRNEVSESYRITQAYIAPNVRIRKVTKADQTWPFEYIVTVKKNTGSAIERIEIEFKVDRWQGEELLDAFKEFKIQKVRHLVKRGNDIWEIDVFEGRHSGIRIAEIELTSATQVVDLPEWVGAEVTDKEEYSNSHMARNM